AAVSIRLLHVDNMNDALTGQKSRRSGPRVGVGGRVILAEFSVSRRHSVSGDSAPVASIIGLQHTECRAAQLHCPIEHCVEYRREVSGRGIDDLQYLRGG